MDPDNVSHKAALCLLPLSCPCHPCEKSISAFSVAPFEAWAAAKLFYSVLFGTSDPYSVYKCMEPVTEKQYRQKYDVDKKQILLVHCISNVIKKIILEQDIIATEIVEVAWVSHLARPPDQMDPLMTFIEHFIRPCWNTCLASLIILN